jgi:AraC family ethanolamine operon transcriptional activator
MPGSRASVFGEAEDFQAALSADGVAGLLVTGRGQFRARMTQVALKGLRLAAVEEQLARIAFVAVPAGMVLVAFPIDAGLSPVWGGNEIRPREIITFGPGQRLHARTVGPSHWGAIQVLEQLLAQYGRAVSGTRFAVPSAARWRPRATAVRELRGLHRAAIRMAEARAAAFTDIKATHGLEQLLLHALIECLSEGGEEETATGLGHRGILARFEDWLIAEPFLSMSDLCVALSVSSRLLRECCKEHLGIGPSSYRRLCAMQQVHRALRNGNLDGVRVSEVASRHGFRALGRFATNYCAVYGELPSATLRRALRPGMGELSLGRQRVKFS